MATPQSPGNNHVRQLTSTDTIIDLPTIQTANNAVTTNQSDIRTNSTHNNKRVYNYWKRSSSTTRKHILNAILLFIEICTIAACIVAYTCDIVQYTVHYLRHNIYGQTNDYGQYKMYVYWNRLYRITTDTYALAPNSLSISERTVTYSDRLSLRSVHTDTNCSALGTAYIILYAITLVIALCTTIVTLSRILKYTYRTFVLEIVLYTVTFAASTSAVMVYTPCIGVFTHSNDIQSIGFSYAITGWAYEMFAVVALLLGYIILYIIYNNKLYRTRLSFIHTDNINDVHSGVGTPVQSYRSDVKQTPNTHARAIPDTKTK